MKKIAKIITNKTEYEIDLRKFYDLSIAIDPNKKSPSFKNIGYSEIYSFLKEEISLDEAINKIKKSTRNLNRHQYNWFKLTDNRIQWIDISGKNDNNYALNIILNDLR